MRSLLLLLLVVAFHAQDSHTHERLGLGALSWPQGSFLAGSSAGPGCPPRPSHS